MQSSEPPDSWDLAVTERCLTSDLGLDLGCVTAGYEDPATQDADHQVLAAFRERRASAPEGVDRIQGLDASISAFSLHAGRYRGLTWYDRDQSVVWLIAAGWHESGARDDAYQYFRGLDRSQLIPSADDYRRLIRRRAVTFAQALTGEVPALLETAKQRPNEIQSATIAERLRVRVVYEDSDDPPTISFAVDQRLLPGTQRMASNWQLMLAQAFLGERVSDITDVSHSSDLAGAPLLPSEVAWCDFADEE